MACGGFTRAPAGSALPDTRERRRDVLQFKNYARPETVEEAYELLRKGRMNRVLGGGVWLRLQDRRISTVIDLSACGLDKIEETEDSFVIGSMVTLHQLETHAAFNDATCHVFEHAVRDIVGTQMRNCATVGGSVFGRFGFSDVLTALLALDCEVELAGAGVVSLASFVNMPYERDVLAHVIVHKHDYAASFAAVRRSATDFPVLNVCAARWDGWHVAVGARPTRARLLEGERLALPDDFTPEQLDAACERLSELPMGPTCAAASAIAATSPASWDAGPSARPPASRLPRQIPWRLPRAPSAPATTEVPRRRARPGRRRRAPAHDPAPTQARKGGAPHARKLLHQRRVRLGRRPPDMRLLDFLRTRGLKSVKCGCETTNCGLCTVWLDGTPVLSCAELMCRMNGRYVTTLEGLVDESAEFARCMAEEGAEQCGFCSPGLIMNVLALKRDCPDASDEQIRRALSGNLCRCTGYASQMRAVRRFLGRETVAAGTVARPPWPPCPPPATRCSTPPRSPRRPEDEHHLQLHRPRRARRESWTVSHAVVKKDAKGLLQGRAVYTNDLAPRDAYIVRLLRSPHAHARIRSIDTHRALRIDGIVAIYTYEDVPHARYTLAGQSFREMSPYDTLILDRTVRYVGDEVAIVVGTDELAINAAMRLIKVDYEVLPAVTDFTQALDNPVVVHDEDDIRAYVPMGEDFSRNLISHEQSVYGDVDAVLADADVVIEHDYETQATQQSMMETFRSYAYTDAQDRVCVVASTQVPFHIRRQVATALQIPQSRVRVIKPRVGGGFGAKQTGCNEIFSAFAALKLGASLQVHLHARGDHGLRQHAPQDAHARAPGRQGRRHDHGHRPVVPL